VRLDHFLPTLTRIKGRPPRLAKWPSRLAQKLLPAEWLSHWESRKAGAIRRALKRLGPTWLSSPVRRVIQGVCFVLFLWFFFYSCWPYRVQPAPVWKAWIPVEIDADTGDCRVTAKDELPGVIREGDLLHISDESPSGHATAYLGPFVVRRAENKELHLHPEKAMTPEALEKMSVSTGPWMLSVRPPNEWPSHYADEFARRDEIPVEAFLLIDPLVSLSTAVAAKAWMGSLWGAAIILAVCVFIPRGFCGYVCPLGTLIDLFDWAVVGRVKRWWFFAVSRGNRREGSDIWFFGIPSPWRERNRVRVKALDKSATLESTGASPSPQPSPAGRGRTATESSKPRLRVPEDGWWVHLKYYLLFGVMLAAFSGVLLSGIVSAIPVLTRGLLFLLAPLQLGFMRGWHQVPPMNLGQIVSIVLFLAVLGLGFFRPRFWCKYVCPSGAVFSLGNLFRVSERKVENTCIHCNKCVEICPFDAIKPDFTTRVTDCTLCQTCGGVCPTHAIKFVERSNRVALKLENDPPTGERSLEADLHWLFSRERGRASLSPASRAGRVPSAWRGSPGRTHPPRLMDGFETAGDLDEPTPSPLPGGEFEARARNTAPLPGRAGGGFVSASIGRRSFVSSGIGLLAAFVGGLGSTIFTKAFGARLSDSTRPRPVRPPGSVPEQEFLELCIRCGECFKVCPNSVLQPLGFQQGLEGMWTPYVAADWAGCEPSCNACGKACPTGAIRPLPLAEKKVARMGLAVVNEQICLPLAGKEACQLCVDECAAAGYDAIEFIRVHSQADDSGKPIESTGFLAPKVLPDKCVGCGLCQMRCYSINAKTKKLLPESAIIVEAGNGKEDRMTSGSYFGLRAQERKNALPQATNATSEVRHQYLPEFLEKRSQGTPGTSNEGIQPQ